jgi:hypothetical protein
MNDHALQLNYFPTWLDEGFLSVASTDSRRRSDIRFLENGFLCNASDE